ncbi:MAG: undecaprenyl-phosphate glucose phosphotransferase [Bacteroidales bacterium]|nr:undecaprenyl-phosphate glucose phosphotransferase [Bacteroidales bacterium]
MIDHQIPSQKSVSVWSTLIIDLSMLNLLLWGAVTIFPDLYAPNVFALWSASYVLSFCVLPPMAVVRMVGFEDIMRRSFWTSVATVLSFLVLNFLFKNFHMHNLHILCLAIATIATLFLSRYIDKQVASSLRKRNRDNCSAVFVGAGVNLRQLYNSIKDPATGYNIHGYFENQESQHLKEMLPLLGKVSDLVEYLQKHHVDLVICNLDEARREEITMVMNYCENHLIKFYSVLNTQNYMNRAMNLEFIDKYPVITMRQEPLSHPFSRGIKRTFDILASFMAIVLFSPIYIITAIIIKCTSPGPIFFCQKRTGKNGEDFICYKFRSMKVNSDADKVQATANDPRKYPFGNFMRKTNIDELPQFFNVLIGNMSIVGPRPHMLAHTDQYRVLVDKYMVRHYAKPGITGWAQVTGSRGETRELWQMEERIQKDIWYLENWSFFLDIKIIWKTVMNMIFNRDKSTAY